MKMEKYDVLGSLGEGSFGRVYQARQLSNGALVALKVISKRNRSSREIKDLRGECQIQRRLNHPNIIQMLDSFETENEIVVITEFAHKQLMIILGEKGYLAEDRVQTIVWDLVSALYYLHSNRILHRDLKPQNILLDEKNNAKLCDFGFARNMSTGTHVLTSIKGTPLYMAPELINELPYDHSADLWSLGCIIYELLVGAPPFCTSSILELIRLISTRPVQWPTFLSEDCISFLKGLLQKDPKQRMGWPEILKHPFVKGHILTSENKIDMPLTRPLSSNTLQLKDQQRKDIVNQKSRLQTNRSVFTKTNDVPSKTTTSKVSKEEKLPNESIDTHELDIENNNPTICEKMNNLSMDSKKEVELKKTSDKSVDSNKSSSAKDITVLTENLKIIEENHPIETDEWIAFLQKTIEEVINGEMISLTQPNLASVLVSPLRNSNTSPKVLSYVAKLCSIPFVIRGTPQDTIEQIKKTYLQIKLVPNIIYSSKLLSKVKFDKSSSTASGELTAFNLETLKSVQDLTDEDLEALECMFLLISHLVYTDDDFLIQFCDAIVVLNVHDILRSYFSLHSNRTRILLDLLSILTHILRKFPENCDIVEKILNSVTPDNESLDFLHMLRHEDYLLRERLCYFFIFLSKYCLNFLETTWNEKMKETLEALIYDSIGQVREAAEKCVEELQSKEFY